MGKKKKITEKVKLFYRGPLIKPSKVANEHEMQTIVCALKDSILKKDCGFEVDWKGKKLQSKLSIGLSSCLRNLKQKRTLAILYDDTASLHLSKYLNEFSSKLDIPIIAAHRLIDLAPDLNLQTLLAVSIVTIPTGNEEIYTKDSDPRPKPIKEILNLESFNKLCQIFQDINDPSKIIQLKPPVVDKIASTGKSKAKKEVKRNFKKAKFDCSIESKQTHMVE